MVECKIGSVIENWDRKTLICVDERTKGRIYRDGCYYIYAEDTIHEIPNLTEEDLEHFYEVGKAYREEKGLAPTEPIPISDLYHYGEITIGGTAWETTKVLVEKYEEEKEKYFFKLPEVPKITIPKVELPELGIAKYIFLFILGIIALLALGYSGIGGIAQREHERRR